MAPAGIDTSSEEWRLVCLARHICHLPAKVDRHAFLAKLQKHHGDEFRSEMEQRVRAEWVGVRAEITSKANS